MQLRDIMTSNVSSINPSSSVNEAARIMRDLNVGSVPVCEGSKPVGMVTDRDIAIRNVANNENPGTPVQQIMSTNMVVGRPDMTAREAATIMADNQIRRLPIIENGNLVGVVSLGDLAVEQKSDMEAGKALSTISNPSKPDR